MKFQSTHPCGVRPISLARKIQVCVSIHAPVWGATLCCLWSKRFGCFNPRTRVGCDLQKVDTNWLAMFQSTHPCGVRRLARSLLYHQISFNPRTRVGCDPEEDGSCGECCVSIHAPVWGATILNFWTRTATMFQSTHPCGVRHLEHSPIYTGEVSIHAPVWGATRYGDSFPRIFGFNPRTRVGCDRRCRTGTIIDFVSIHAPVWGATLPVCRFQSPKCCFNPRTRVGCDEYPS